MKRNKILIVEDDATTAEMLTRIIDSPESPEISVVVSGELAVEFARESCPELILMDINLSGRIDGIAASMMIKKFCDCPIIFITSSADHDTIERAMGADPYGYIVKPLVMRDVKNIIRMAGQKYSLEKSLKKSEALYKGIVEQFPFYIFRLAHDRETVTFANKSFTDEFPRTGDTVIGMNIADVIPNEIWPVFRETFSSITRDEPVKHIEFKIAAKNNDVWQRWICHGIYDASGRLIEFQSIGDDITEIRNLQTEIVRAGERETRRLAGDLHDDLGQKLTYLGFLAQIVKREMASAGLTPYQELDVMVDLVDETAGQMRRIYKGLVPVTIEPEGFIYAVDEFAATTAKFLKRQIDFSVTGEIIINDNLTATNLFYITREAVNNAFKHSRSGIVSINIECTGKKIIIKVENECGGDNTCIESSPGMGLRIMKYRADLIDARLQYGLNNNTFFLQFEISDTSNGESC